MSNKFLDQAMVFLIEHGIGMSDPQFERLRGPLRNELRKTHDAALRDVVRHIDRSLGARMTRLSAFDDHAVTVAVLVRHGDGPVEIESCANQLRQRLQDWVREGPGHAPWWPHGPKLDTLDLIGTRLEQEYGFRTRVDT